jgi:hypothetical protein
VIFAENRREIWRLDKPPPATSLSAFVSETRFPGCRLICCSGEKKQGVLPLLDIELRRNAGGSCFHDCRAARGEDMTHARLGFISNFHGIGLFSHFFILLCMFNTGSRRLSVSFRHDFDSDPLAGRREPGLVSFAD